MHELSLAATILESTLAHCASLEKVLEVHVSVGCLVMASPEQLAFGFELLAGETRASGARLVIEMTAARARCQRGHETTMDVEEIRMGTLLALTHCQACGAPARVVEGRDIVLTRIVGE